MPAHASTAAVAKSTASGSGTRLRSGTTTYSASPPAMLKPSCPGKVSQTLGRPARHCLHQPQNILLYTATRSPDDIDLPSPAISTTPSASWPSVVGYGAGLRTPC